MWDESVTESVRLADKFQARSVIGYVIVVAFVVLCGHYVFVHWSDFAFVAKVSFPEMAGATLFILIGYTINALQLRLFLSHFGLVVGFTEAMALTAGMLLGNLVMPMRAGTGGLALYLKRVHGLDFQAFAAIYGGTALLVALINTGLAAGGLILLGWLHGFMHGALTGFVSCLFAACLYLSIFPPPIRWNRPGLLGMVFEAVNSWHALTRNRPLLICQILVTLAMALAVMGAFYLIYSSLGMPLPLSAVLITSSMGNIASIIPITPGSLGIFDAVVIQIPQIFGLDPARAIAATLLFRVLSFAWALGLGIPGILYVLRTSREERE